MISALSWLPRGAAAAVPAPAPLNEEELAALKRTAADAAAGILQVCSSGPRAGHDALQHAAAELPLPRTVPRPALQLR